MVDAMGMFFWYRMEAYIWIHTIPQRWGRGQDVSVLMTQEHFPQWISSMKQEENCIEKEEV